MTTLSAAQREFTVQYVRQAIVVYGSKRRAAKVLGIERSSLYRILRASPPVSDRTQLVATADSR